MSTISASTTSTTAFKITTDTTGTLVFQTGASPTTAVTFDGSQNVGVGVTPSAWASTSKAIQLGSTATLENNNNLANYLGFNSYRSATGIKYLTTGYTQLFGLENDGGFKWYQAASGTAGTTPSFTQTMTLNASGNLGLGVTPSAWYASSKAIQIAPYAAIEGISGANITYANAYRNASNALIYLSNDYATSYSQNAGVHSWQTAASGTAGGTISFTQAMTLNASGNLGVGVTSIASNAKVHVGGSLRAGSTTYNASPASTLFNNTLAGNGSDNRVVNFDGNGSTTSVWWTSGSRAYSAVDADGTNNLAFWANNGTTWQKQVNVNYGSVDLLYTVNATGGLMTVANPNGSSYNENMRLPRGGGNYVSVCLATDSAASSGTIDGQFNFVVCPSNISNGQFSIRTYNTDALIIQKSGYITTPLNPAFEAKGDSARVDATTGWSKVLYSQSVNQRGSAYSSGSSRFTAPIAGWYQFNAQWSANDNADTDGTFTFAINGSQSGNKGTVSMPNTGGGYDGHSMAATMYLALNDYVEVYRYSTTSTTTRSNDWQGWFSGHLIG